MKMKSALVALSLVALGILALVLVPRAGAWVSEFFLPFWVFRLPGGQSFGGISDARGMEPVNVTYLPPGKWSSSMGGRNEDGVEYIVLKYLLEDHFVVLSQGKMQGTKELPSGTAIHIGNQPAVIARGLQGSVRLWEITDNIPNLQDTPYTDGRQITWYSKNAKVELFSNLPEEEMLKIAESVQPTEKREAKFISQFGGPPIPYLSIIRTSCAVFP